MASKYLRTVPTLALASVSAEKAKEGAESTP
jgi:hypothetical protein